ncbi:alginate export family protein [Nitrospinae bacterium AH_259_B05_G02_I21]|nr:alginate export family protein [Nitrospinae bacterium AH_259_B05_G02_I21]
MRKVFIASVGTLLVLFLATSGYPAQGTAAVQASGDITLNFGIQHEIDFQVRDNYDFDNGLTDGCTRAATTGDDCSGTSGVSAVTDSFPDGSVVQETRLIMTGSQGDIWKARIVLETEAAWSPENPNMGVERAWTDIKLYDTPVHVKAGRMFQPFDPFWMVFADDDDAVRVYATHGNISWATMWVKALEVADDNGATSGRDADADYWFANVNLDFGAFQVTPALAYLRNHQTTTDTRFATGLASVDNFSAAHNFRTAGTSGSNISGVSVDEDVVYPGLWAKGTFGPVSFVGEVFGAFGEIGDDSANDAQRNQDVAAFLVAADVGVKLGAWTPHVYVIYASGDDNPHDDDAEAWSGIESFTGKLGGARGIFVEDELQKIGIERRSITAETVNPVARGYGIQPGIILLGFGLKGRPTKKIKTDLNVLFIQWDMEKQWEYVNGMVTTTTCTPTQTQSQSGVCSNSNFTSAVADGSGLISTVDDEVGWELNGTVTYDYNKHVSLRLAAAVFFPGDGTEVVAQCANAAGGGFNINGEDGAQGGCSDGINVSAVSGIARADDEAVRVDVELMVAF